MSQQGEAAEQIVNMATNVTVKGVECVTNLAGKGAMSLATFLVATLKDQKKTQGKARMRAFHGKPTKVFVIKAKDMKLFAEEAKKYGVLYAAVVNKKQPDGLVDVVVNAADAAKVNRIAERFALSTVDVEKIREDIEKARQQRRDAEKMRTDPPNEKDAYTVDDKTLGEMMGEPVPQANTHKQPIEVEQPVNPTKARTEKSNLSEPFLKTQGDTAVEKFDRPSVRSQIQEIKSRREAEKAKPIERSKNMEPNRHKSVKKNKSKGR